MKHYLIRILSVCCFLTATANKFHAYSTGDRETTSPAQSIHLKVATQGGMPIDGLGAEVDPHFLSSNVAAGIGVNESVWDSVVIPRLRDLSFSKWRVMILPWWYEPVNDNENPSLTDSTRFTFHSPQMLGLCNQLDIAQHDSIPVCLVFWGTRPNTFLLPEPADGWVFGPSQYEEWAENISACLQYLFDQGYTCIREVTPVNEPDWSFISGSTSRPKRYAQMCEVLHRRLQADGLRERVLLTLSDDSDGGTGRHSFLQEAVNNLPQADLFCSHTYIFGYDTPNDSITNWERTNVRLAAQRGKRHFVGEFGSNLTVNATRQRDIDRPERGVLMGRILINLLNAGATGASYWSVMDQYYSIEEAQQHKNMQQLGLWRHLRQEYSDDTTQYRQPRCDYELRPQYHAMRLLSHAVRHGDRVFPIHTHHPFLAATALLSPDNKWTYLLANPTDTTWNVTIHNPTARKRFTLQQHSYLCEAPEKNFHGIHAMPIHANKGKISMHIPAHSLVSLTTNCRSTSYQR
ncbi:MAG: hypothetical protein ACI4B5_08470 [Bacteroidaceae bacterium]